MRIFLAIFIALIITGSTLAEDNFVYSAKDRRDPFIPLVSKDGAYVSDAYGIKDIRLEGIVWDQVKGSVAIINGEIVREGEEVGPLKVLKIEETAVIFDLNGEKVRIELIPD